MRAWFPRTDEGIIYIPRWLEWDIKRDGIKEESWSTCCNAQADQCCALNDLAAILTRWKRVSFGDCLNIARAIEIKYVWEPTKG
jgi:hypothetical protein